MRGMHPGHRRARWLLIMTLAAASVAICADSAHASSVLEILGATTGGNQFTARLFSHSSAASYFNPSLLPEAAPKIEVGVYSVSFQGRIRLNERPAGVDVPASVYTTNDPFRPLATTDLPYPRSDTHESDNVTYAVIGLVRPLIGRSLVFGLHALLPIRTLLAQNGFFADEREQYFSNKLHYELLGDRLDVSSFNFALGWRVVDQLSIGVGIDMSLFTESRTAVYIPDASNQGTALLSPNIRTSSRFNPCFAATVHPSPRTTIIATLHLPSSDDLHGTNDLRFWNYAYPAGQNSVPQVYTLSQGNEPRRLSLGSSVSGTRRPDGRAPWEIGAQVIAERWSRYRDRHGASPLDPWSDTLSYAVGGGFMWHDRHVTADVGYVPSPVPDQTGRTNYVDNTRFVASAGIEGPLQLWGHELEAGLSLFGSVLVPREVTKAPNAAHPVLDEFPDGSTNQITGLPADGAAGLQTNNPGYPGWKSTGFMVGAGLSIRLAR
jgi:long-chain fatty acid transport protein